MAEAYNALGNRVRASDLLTLALKAVEGKRDDFPVACAPVLGRVLGKVFYVLYVLYKYILSIVYVCTYLVALIRQDMHSLVMYIITSAVLYYICTICTVI